MVKEQAYTITKVTESEVSEVITFMMKIRKEVFPMLDQIPLPKDLAQFEDYYLHNPLTNVYVARSRIRNEVIGTIGIQQYDDRFDDLTASYQGKKIAEIVKCYIEPDYRRLGIGTALFTYAEAFCKQVGYDLLYLHTHPFLPGAISFWERKGFTIRLREEDPIWKTIHMDKEM